jgi:hypothetical protein
MLVLLLVLAPLWRFLKAASPVAVDLSLSHF